MAGRFANLLGTLLDTFSIGPKGARATLDASGLTAERTYTAPDKTGVMAMFDDTLVHVSDTSPTSPTNGRLWLNSATLGLYAYYDDGTSQQWVEMTGGGGVEVEDPRNNWLLG